MSSLFRIISVCIISILCGVIILKLQKNLSLGDMLFISLFGSVLVTVGSSVVRSPAQFARALWERVIYVVWVPLAMLIVLGLVAFRILFILFKLSLKGLMAAVVGILYVLSPIDLMPDFIPILGQIDDIMVVITLVVWAVSISLSETIKSSIAIVRPSTQFP